MFGLLCVVDLAINIYHLWYILTDLYELQFSSNHISIALKIINLVILFVCFIILIKYASDLKNDLKNDLNNPLNNPPPLTNQTPMTTYGSQQQPMIYSSPSHPSADSRGMTPGNAVPESALVADQTTYRVDSFARSSSNIPGPNLSPNQNSSPLDPGI